eukprot:TRINITY_DN10104_c0_g1_i1.p1 TRINITY_DN10104_c0_g1~~TRINITY_DN10104_c0_g1_i1.p1  ORF type:complete len:964 (+),score=480.20 TRINITY_DN10104_c0_g1_i1:61-2952(+)
MGGEKRKRAGSSSSEEDEEARRAKEAKRRKRREEHERQKRLRKEQKDAEREQILLAKKTPEERKVYERLKEQKGLEAEQAARRDRVRVDAAEAERQKALEEQEFLLRKVQYDAQNESWNLEEDNFGEEEVLAAVIQDENRAAGLGDAEGDGEPDPFEAFMAGLKQETATMPSIIGVDDQPKTSMSLAEIKALERKEKLKKMAQKKVLKPVVVGATPAAVADKEPEEPVKAEDDEAAARAFIESLKQINPEEEAPDAKERAKQEDEEKLQAMEQKSTKQEKIELDFDDAEFEEREYKLKQQEIKVKDLKPIDHSTVAYQPFRKNFYTEAAALSKLSAEELKDRRKALDKLKVRSDVPIPAPIETWEQAGLSDDVLTALKDLHYEVPFPIQAQGLPVIMQGHDMIGCARTGSGKTLAYVLPMLRHILYQDPLQEFDGPIAFVLVPTRELALQIEREMNKFGGKVGVKTLAAYGGVSIADQIKEARRGVHCMVGTPGRIIDLLVVNRGKTCNTYRATYCVLDEADRLFDMGFGPQVAKIVNNIRPDRQVVMFSATFPKQVEAAAKKFLNKPIEVIVGSRSTPSTNVTQFVECFENEDHKFLRLLQLVGEWHQKGLILIFAQTQDEVDSLWQDFFVHGYNQHCLTLHGGMNQIDRELALHQFELTQKRVLIATSVASRGIDVPDIEVVINYNVPSHYEDYVHRIGRTGRAGKRGTSFTFYTIGQDEQHSTWLVKALEASNNEVPEELQTIANNFWTQRKDGLVNWRPTDGYNKGRGFKFDKKEAKQKRDDIKMQMKARGLLGDESDDEEASDDGGHVDVEMSKERVANVTAAGGSLVVHSDAKVRKAQEYALKLSTQIQQREQMAAENKFTAEIEINDYPAMARWKLTNRDQCQSLIEQFEATAMAKGVYCAKGNPAPGERKIYVQIDGKTEADVMGAKKVIQDFLDTEMEKLLTQGSAVGVGKRLN